MFITEVFNRRYRQNLTQCPFDFKILKIHTIRYKYLYDRMAEGYAKTSNESLISQTLRTQQLVAAWLKTDRNGP